MSIKLKKPRRRFRNERELVEHRMEALRAITKKPKTSGERQCVQKTVQWLDNKYGNSIYTFIDQDIGTVRTKSGWDFLISIDSKTVYIEAKKNNETLSDFQLLTREKILSSNGVYLILRFFIDTDKTIFGVILDDPFIKTDITKGKEISKYTLEDFRL